jgi:lipid-A-disaccharide synthase
MKDKCIWILAGESSGDVYGADLAREISKVAPNVVVKGMGGVNMRAAGVEIFTDSSELGVMGFVEVAKLYPMFMRILRDMTRMAREERPDVVVTIDYPGFNLKFAKIAHELGIKTVHYVAPQVWAWGKKRLKTMPNFIDKLLGIFPFEKNVWSRSGIDFEFVGHPLVESLARDKVKVERSKDTVLLLPGSRKSELDRLLMPLLMTAKALQKKRPNLCFVIPTPRENIRNIVVNTIAKCNFDFPIKVTCGYTEDWLRQGTCAIASSGTVTMQAAILGLPLVSVYKMNPISLFFLKRMIDLPYFTMANIISDKIVYEEFLQGSVKPSVLVPAIERILPGGERVELVSEGMREMVKELGGKTHVAKNVADSVLSLISK